MDSANILSILQTLGANGQGGSSAPAQGPAAPPVNVMQAAAAPPPPQSPSPQFQDPTAQVAQAATDASPPMPKPRHSLVDIIGHIADGLAQAGGAVPMYQKTLDDELARRNAVDDHTRKVNADNIALATSKFDLSDKQRTAGNDERSRFANVLDAVNDAEDANNMPAMMAAAGLTDNRYAPFIKMVQGNPEQAKVLASALGAGDGEDKLGHNLYFGTGPNGKTVAYQIGDDGQPHILDFSGAGVTPSDPIKVVNTGDKTQIIGANGLPKKVLPNTVSPNTAATVGQSNMNNKRTTDTQLTIAGMPARAQPGKTAAGTKGDPGAMLITLDNIQHGFDRLHSLQALPGEGGALNQVEGAIGRTGIGQKIGAQFNAPAAQQRLTLQKSLKTLQSDMIASLPASATRTKFEQEIQNMRLPDPMQMSYETANQVISELKQSYQRALTQSQAEVSKGGAASAGGGNAAAIAEARRRGLIH